MGIQTSPGVSLAQDTCSSCDADPPAVHLVRVPPRAPQLRALLSHVLRRQHSKSMPRRSQTLQQTQRPTIVPVAPCVTQPYIRTEGCAYAGARLRSHILIGPGREGIASGLCPTISRWRSRTPDPRRGVTPPSPARARAPLRERRVVSRGDGIRWGPPRRAVALAQDAEHGGGPRGAKLQGR